MLVGPWFPLKEEPWHTTFLTGTGLWGHQATLPCFMKTQGWRVAGWVCVTRLPCTTFLGDRCWGRGQHGLRRHRWVELLMGMSEAFSGAGVTWTYKIFKKTYVTFVN